MDHLDHLEYRIELINLFDQRKRRNPSYSLRSFARDLGISTTALHGVLKQERHLSFQNIVKVAGALKWSPQRTAFAKLSTKDKESTLSKKEVLSEDRFRFISDWFYLPILNIYQLKSYRTTPSWIARCLGITAKQAKEALLRLKRLDLLIAVEGKFKRKVASFRTTDDVPSLAIQNYHMQSLQQASEHLGVTPLDQVLFDAYVFPVSKEKIPEAKRLLRKLREQFTALVEEQPADSLYQLNIQLYPLTKDKQ